MSLVERERMKTINGELESVWKMEEIKAHQRSIDRQVKEGDRNTAYFMAIAHQRTRKKRIEGLEGPNGWIENNKDMLEHVVRFYKTLFEKEPSSSC